MQLLILGGTGRTGKQIVEEALRRGHHVHVLVREVARLQVKSNNITVFEGLPTNAELLQSAIKGCDAIISALNISRTSDFPWAKLRTPKDFLSNTMATIIPLAEKYSVNHVAVISASGAGDSRQDVPGFFRWLIDHSNIGYAYREHENQERLLKESRLNWTAIRPVGLTNSSKVKKVRVSIDGKPRPNMTIGRKTVAHFLLDVVEQRKHLRETPTISEE